MAYRYFIKLAYDGTAYAGWQVQPNATTVQQLINDGLTAILRSKHSATGCGRTDTGVHAANFYAHFDHENAFSPEELSQLTHKLNGFLPQDIVIFEIISVVTGAHARYSALWRQYEYEIIRRKDPFKHTHSYLIHDRLDIDAMNRCTDMLIGRHDFKCFSKVNTQVNNYFCDVQLANWSEKNHTLIFTIRADRFLRNMVRAIVGTLLDVGNGRISIDKFREILESRDRCQAGFSVPAKGLTLTEVCYPEDLFSEKPVFFSPQND